MTEQEESDFEMKPEYDFSKAIRNPYSKQAKELRGLRMVALDDDVAKVFRTAENVNTALRWLLQDERLKLKAS